MFQYSIVGDGRTSLAHLSGRAREQLLSQGILCSVGEPRWRSKNIRGAGSKFASKVIQYLPGADAKWVASMFRRHGDKGPNREAGG